MNRADRQFESPQQIASVAEPHFSVVEYKGLATNAFIEGHHAQALQYLATALMLPVDPAEVAPVAADLSIMIPALIGMGGEQLLMAARFRWAVASMPGVLAAAEAQFQAMLADGNPLLLDEQAIGKTNAYFAALTGKAEDTSRLGSLLSCRNGRPYLDIVWFEITNHCNQKCTFCPDPHRAGPRVSVTLETFQRLVDDLADNFSVGSMQLNAYGEPLLNVHIEQMLQYLRQRQVPWRTYFTTHGMTLVPAILKKLSYNYPQGIAVSLQNDGQASYAATRSAKIGDYDTMVSRVSALISQIVAERAACHVRLYLMVTSTRSVEIVPEHVARAFPSTIERVRAAVRQWEAIAHQLVAQAPPEARAVALTYSDEVIDRKLALDFQTAEATLPILRWRTERGKWENVFITFRPLSSYGRQIIAADDPVCKVHPVTVAADGCSFTRLPSLAIRATGHLGMCCIDLEGEANFGHLDDYANLTEALSGPRALRLFGELSNGVCTTSVCQVCMGKVSRAKPALASEISVVAAS